MNAQVLPNELLDGLVEIGRKVSSSKLNALIAVNPSCSDGQFMRQLPQFWREIASGIGNGELVALIKALTIVERDVPNCVAGSVSPVIWLFEVLRSRGDDQLDELAEWVLGETSNPFLPWGSSNFGARTVDQFQQRSSAYEQHCAKRAAKEQARQEADRVRIAKTASYNLYGAIRRDDEKAIASLMRKGADPTKTWGDWDQSPLDYARSLGAESILPLLEPKLNSVQ